MTDQDVPLVFRYEKVVFSWDKPRPLISVPDRLRFKSVTRADLHLFVTTIEQVLEGSLDRFDQIRVARSTAREIAESYARPNKNDFIFKLSWWQFAYTMQGEIVGFTQPVVFRGGTRGSLKEGTIHYIGVIPKHRGQGYSFDLLSAATRKLQKVRVWRIYCDTDVQNAPMISAFLRAGYTKGRKHTITYRWPLNP